MLTGCGILHSNKLPFVKTFGVEIPEVFSMNDVTELHKVGTRSGNGDGEYCKMLELKKALPDNYLADFYTPLDTEFCEQNIKWLNSEFDKLEIPSKFLPDWDKDFYIKMFTPVEGCGKDLLYIIY